ncbi:MAG TPA: VanZ family protein [Cytophagales bacterium]|nr:VanZ family protein [Cytophagales bacterium]
MGNKASKPGNLRFIRYDILTLIWIFVIMGLTFTPGPNIPPLPHWELISFDTFVHAVIFATLVFLSANAFKRLKENSLLKRHPFVFSFVLSFFFGCLIEIIQPYIPGRTFDYYDILSNSIGAIIGIFAVFTRSYFFSSSGI